MKHKDIKPLRIILSVFLAIISVVCFTCFVSLRTARVAFSRNIISEVISNINLFDAEIGSIASGLNIDGIDEDSTVSDAVSLAVVEVAKEEFNYNVTKEEVDEVLEDPNVQEAISNLSGDFFSGVISGNFDGKEFADDIEEAIVDNKELIEDVSGYEITDEMIEEIRDNVGKFDAEYSANTDIYSEFTKYTAYITDTLIYGFLGAAVLCVVGIMLLNMFKLPTGFRTNGISFLVDALFAGVAGVVVRFSPKLIMSIIEELVSSNGVHISTGVVNDLIDSYAANLAKQMWMPALIFLGLGIGCMVMQGVLLTISKDK